MIPLHSINKKLGKAGRHPASLSKQLCSVKYFLTIILLIITSTHQAKAFCGNENVITGKTELIRHNTPTAYQPNHPYVCGIGNTTLNADKGISRRLLIGGGVTLGLGIGALCTGLSFLNTKNDGYKIARPLIYTGMGLSLVSIPFFVLVKNHHCKANKRSTP